MSVTDLFLTLLTIFMLVLALFLTNRWVPEDASRAPEQAEIPMFFVDAHFDPYPSTVNIENAYDCNASSLRVCDMDDNSTLFGCKELTVRCQHFDNDTKYMNDGEERIIPKNKSKREGYALAIASLPEACNPYHGDLVLVAANRESTEYMMICECKNPGYIGNENLLGSCSSVFICNGKVDDINQPLDKLNCVCDANKISKRSSVDNNAPICETMTVKEANEKYSNWSHLINIPDASALPLEHFNATIRGNLNVSFLLNPCTTSLLDPTERISGGKYDYFKQQCQFDDGGIPVRTNILDSGKKVEGTVDAAIPSGPYYYMRFTDNVAGRRKRAVIKTDLAFHPTLRDEQGFVLLPEGIRVGDGPDGQLIFPIEEKFAAPKCEGNWPRYSCSIRSTYLNSSYGIPMPDSRSCPGEFLWGQDWWNDSEFLTSRSMIRAEDGLAIKQTELTKSSLGRLYGFAFKNKKYSNSESVTSGLLQLINESDYIKHKNTIT